MPSPYEFITWSRFAPWCLLRHFNKVFWLCWIPSTHFVSFCCCFFCCWMRISFFKTTMNCNIFLCPFEVHWAQSFIPFFWFIWLFDVTPIQHCLKFRMRCTRAYNRHSIWNCSKFIRQKLSIICGKSTLEKSSNKHLANRIEWMWLFFLSG